jgi:hypothetical protein
MSTDEEFLNIRAVFQPRFDSGLVSTEFTKKLGGGTGRDGTRPRAPVIAYGASEARCHNFTSRKGGGTMGQIRGRTTQGEAWLHQMEQEEIMGSDDFEMKTSTKGFGPSARIRAFVNQVLIGFSPTFSHFSWSLEPYGCTIREIAKSEKIKPLPRDLKKSLERAILRDIKSHKRNPFRGIDQTNVVIDHNGKIRGSRRRDGAIRPFWDMRDGITMHPDGPETTEHLEAVIRLTPRIQVTTKDGEIFLLSQLSDGEQRLFSIFVDIARQLFIYSKGNLPIDETPALVMIDEIDVHLHPKWQRMIVPRLEELFRSCQFIATTHSPFVIQAVTEEQLISLSEPIAGYTNDRGIEEIVAKVMGIESHQVSKRYLEMLDAAKDYFVLLERESPLAKDDPAKLVKLKNRLDSLRHPYADNPAYQAYLELFGTLTLGSSKDEAGK